MPRWLTRLHVWVYRRSGGRVLGRMGGQHVLLLQTTGRHSGRTRTTPVQYLGVDDTFVVVASNAGAAQHPAWYLNLREHPEVEVQIKGEVFRATARDAQGDERDRLWDQLVEVWPPYADYQQRTDREIPVVVLERAG